MRRAEFFVKEEAHNLSRENVMFSPSQSIVPGQIVGANIAVDGNKRFAAFNPTAADGTQVAAGISVYRVITSQGSTVKSPIINRIAVVKGKDLTWPAGITAAQQAEATEQLRTLSVAK
ncbi:head decoration protein [Bradyrhizobium yuanmingense]|uniref:head decoration protein n=1 Tax=Bradyrhizobium yuanmingense TaxID=108015 RepID=UPI0023B99D84|nr:head decoration protein [Bradyrhizobium yuanmingense]MDF0498933.1 head decoration protein [Bradyrhizobium yuanmingense]